MAVFKVGDRQKRADLNSSAKFSSCKVWQKYWLTYTQWQSCLLFYVYLWLMYPTPNVSIVLIVVSLVTVSSYGTSASVSTVVATREGRSIVKTFSIIQRFPSCCSLLYYTLQRTFQNPRHKFDKFLMFDCYHENQFYIH